MSALTEEIVAGCCLLGPAELDEARTLVRPEFFLHQTPQLIFEACCHLRDTGQPVGRRALVEHLRGHGRLDDLGGTPDAYLDDLEAKAPTAAEMHWAAAEVRKAYTAFMVRAVARELDRDVGDRVGPPDELAAQYA